MIGRFPNYIELFNEVCIAYSTLHMMFFTDWVGTNEKQFYMGWSMVVMLVVNFAVNLMIIFYFAFRSLWLVWLR